MNRRRTIRTALCLSLAMPFAFSAGCAGLFQRPNVDYRTIEADPHHDTDAARKKNERALALIAKGDFANAEQALQQALIADVTFAPAHNNLGKLYFQQGKFYLAAWEFEYTKQLIGERAEPYNNLGLVFEQVGRIEQALEMYESAFAIEPQNPEVIGNLARALMKRGDRDPRVASLLEDLRMVDTRPDWLEWANEQLALGKLYGTPVEPTRDSAPPAAPLELLPPAQPSPQSPTSLQTIPGFNQVQPASFTTGWPE